MLNPKTNVCKLRNGVLLSLFACFQDGRQNHTESYIVVDSLFKAALSVTFDLLILEIMFLSFKNTVKKLKFRNTFYQFCKS